jgi:RNA polymerase sigma-70 factor (ECF subfamily)
MPGEEREALESALRAARARGELRVVATRVVEAYGAEILGFLAAVVRDRHDRRDREEAGEVFAQFCEDLWAGLPAFRGEASFRTWAYTLARNAAHRHARDPLRRRGVALSDCPELAELEQRARTATLSYLRSDVKDRVSRLREALDPDDRMLLILRVDRSMSWNEMADVMIDPAPSDDAERARGAASLRKRFERIKDRLRKLAQSDAAALR